MADESTEQGFSQDKGLQKVVMNADFHPSYITYCCKIT